MQTTKFLYKKKGQMAATGTIVGLVVGVGIASLILIFVGVLGGQTYNLVEDDLLNIAGTVNNESFTAVNGTAVSLAEGSINSGTFVVTNNVSSWAVIGSGNYTINLAQGEFTLINNAYAGTLYANYTHGDPSIETSVKNGIKSAFEAQEQTGSYMPIIVLAVVIGVVLAIILGFTFIGGKGSNNVL